MKYEYLPITAAITLLALAFLPDKTTRKLEYPLPLEQYSLQSSQNEKPIMVPPELRRRIQENHRGLTSALIYDYDGDGTKDATLNCKDGSLFVQRDYASGRNPFTKEK